MMAGTVLLASACTDFSDYNEAYTGETSAGGFNSGQTLWENILSDGELSDFAALAQKGGYDEILSASQSYTVWAPKNGTFNVSEYDAMDNASLVNRFLDNHIVRGNVQLSGEINKRVHTLNDKSYRLEGNGQYTFGDVKVSESNKPSANGTVHILEAAQEFRPNIYEYIFEADGVDSVRKYFDRYEYVVLDEEASVVGPVDEYGNQTYLDSVTYVYNSLAENRLNARLNTEDSSYTMFIPNNDAYIKAYKRIEPDFNYIGSLPYTVITFQGETANLTTNTKSIDAAYYKDSLTRWNIVRPSVFSNTNTYNKNGYPDDNVAPDDTICTTRRGKLSNVSDLLSFTQNRDDMEKSNGYARIVDSLAYLPWETWNPEITVYAAGSNMPGATSCSVDKDGQGTITYSTGETEAFTYATLSTSSNPARPTAYFYLPDVLSGAYNIYCVFVSPSYGGGLEREYKVSFTLNYSNAAGVETRANNWTNMETEFYVTADDGTKKQNKLLDTMLVSTEPFTFPVSYYGLSTNSETCAPYFTVQSARAAYNRQTAAGREWDLYDNNLRIASVILRPVEYDEYLKKHE